MASGMTNCSIRSMSAPSLHLPASLLAALMTRAADWSAKSKTRCLWEKDATLWTNRDEAKWLGWLHSTTAQLATMPSLLRFADARAAEGIRDVAVLGMGGSSLCPFVLASTFGAVKGRPRLHVLDSTDPAQIRTFEKGLDILHTLFIVSSKSGSTLEPNIMRDHFLSVSRAAIGPDAANRHFVAVTDPGSQLEKQAVADKFCAIFDGDPAVGGRYSALSAFGMVPAALAGVDVTQLLQRAERMMLACDDDDVGQNPGVRLGLIMGEAALQGRDKLTIFASPGIAQFGVWLEQLIAESTGKQGKGIIPVAGEPVYRPDEYGDDRLFVHLRLEGEDDPQDAAIAQLIAADHPVGRINLPDKLSLGAEFFRWEFATAVAGSVLRINPFDQPDVEAAKIEARKLTDQVEREGHLPPEEPFHAERGITLFADARNTKEITASVTQRTLPAFLRAHFGRLKPRDYAAILAYIEMNSAHESALNTIRHRISEQSRVACTVGFGPRYLHSTGQIHKGGPGTGVFLQVTCDAVQDLPVPGRSYSFGTVEAAQARGDFAVLAERGRRALRVHLGGDVEAGLRTLDAAIQQALS